MSTVAGLLQSGGASLLSNENGIYAMNASMGGLSKHRGSQHQDPKKWRILVRCSIPFQEERLQVENSDEMS